MIGSVLFERSFVDDIKGHSEGTRGGDRVDSSLGDTTTIIQVRSLHCIICSS